MLVPGIGMLMILTVPFALLLLMCCSRVNAKPEKEARVLFGSLPPVVIVR